MATKKKNKKNSKKSKTSKKSASRKPASAKKVQKRVIKKKSAKATVARKTVAKKTIAKKAVAKKTVAKKTVAKKKPLETVGRGKTSRTSNVRTRTRELSLSAFPSETADPSMDIESGDLQGLSNVESADSESVEELVEEGNAFEAGIVSGVEESGEGSVREVRTREVPEDDVPQEYLNPE